MKHYLLTFYCLLAKVELVKRIHAVVFDLDLV